MMRPYRSRNDRFDAFPRDEELDKVIQDVGKEEGYLDNVFELIITDCYTIHGTPVPIDIPTNIMVFRANGGYRAHLMRLEGGKWGRVIITVGTYNELLDAISLIPNSGDYVKYLRDYIDRELVYIINNRTERYAVRGLEIGRQGRILKDRGYVLIHTLSGRYVLTNRVDVFKVFQNVDELVRDAAFGDVAEHILFVNDWLSKPEIIEID